ncbi:hypothetical protein AX15_006944 [Amanita polypyramis BW_CC]|nr:hypothetical protein AX15_006944 [Amanita polypyramis BW_CC]
MNRQPLIHAKPPTNIVLIYLLNLPATLRYQYIDAPFDICKQTRHIFFLVVGNRNRFNKFPWYLGQICESWRMVFHDMKPQFWNEIMVNWVLAPAQDSSRSAEEYYERISGMVDVFLEHSGKRPYFLTFNYLSEHQGHGTPELTNALRVLGKFMESSVRWRSMSIRMYEDELGFLDRIIGQIPLVQCLDIYSTYAGSHSRPYKAVLELFCRIIESAPSLTKTGLVKYPTPAEGFVVSHLACHP